MGLTKSDSMRLKGIAMLMMFFHHLYCQVSRFDGYEISFSPFGQDAVVDVAMFFKLCVSIFAFVSGYGLLTSYTSALKQGGGIGKSEITTRWLLKRLAKLLIGFLAIYVLVFVVTMCIDGMPLEVYFSGSKTAGVVYMIIDALGLANLLGTPTLIGTWWYMSAAIVFIVAVPVLYWVRRIVGWIPVVFGVCAVQRLLVGDYLGGVNAATFLTPVVLGMMFRDLHIFDRIDGTRPVRIDEDGRSSSSVLYGILAVAAIFVCFRINVNISPSVLWELEYGWFVLPFVFAVKYLLGNVPVLSRFLSFMGRHSMTMFLTHSFIRWPYLESVVYGTGNFMLNYVALLVLSVALAVVVDWLLDKVHLHRFISYVTGKIDGMRLTTNIDAA